MNWTKCYNKEYKTGLLAILVVSVPETEVGSIPIQVLSWCVMSMIILFWGWL